MNDGFSSNFQTINILEEDLLEKIVHSNSIFLNKLFVDEEGCHPTIYHCYYKCILIMALQVYLDSKVRTS